MHRIRRYFITGLLVILPVFITLYLLFIIFKFVDTIWGVPINYYLNRNFGFKVPGVGFILGIITVLIVGFVATNLFVRKFFRLIEILFLKFPVIRQVYPAVKQIVSSLISGERRAFKKVVLIEYPSRGIWSVGFLTNESFKEAREKAGRELVHVFIANTPSPFTGFLILVPKDEVKFLDMSVEEGIKLIVSGGILNP
ncbi:MAG: DUF502 domain-containing protein [Candidatus Omnitrophica bacterium]|nr:DUF502 domain-containing protein [Candidatus Omnitrophota bacterium]